MGDEKMTESTPIDQLQDLISSLPESRQLKLLRLLRSGDWVPRGIREHSRKHLALTDPGDHQDIPFTIRDISLGGAFVRTDNLLTMGQEIVLDITLSHLNETVTIPGHVIRITDTGVGIEFTSLDEPTLVLLRKMLTEQQAGIADQGSGA